MSELFAPAIGHILSEFASSQVEALPSTLILEATILQVVCPFSTNTISFLLPSFFFISIYTILSCVLILVSIRFFLFVLCCSSILSFSHVSFHCFLLSNSAMHPHCHLILIFLLPLEVNLHTYLTLTTWLS